MKATGDNAAFKNDGDPFKENRRILKNYKKEKTMGIFTRIIRICKADMHGVMDQMEDRGLLLKQHLRDMETALNQKEIYLKQMKQSANQVEQECDDCKRRMEKIEKEIGIAIKKDKDNIARMLIRKLNPLTVHRDELEQHSRKMDLEIIHLDECLERQRMEYRQMKLSAATYFHSAREKQWEHAMPFHGAVDIQAEPSDEEIELALLQRKEALKGGSLS